MNNLTKLFTYLSIATIALLAVSCLNNKATDSSETQSTGRPTSFASDDELTSFKTHINYMWEGAENIGISA